MKKVLLLIGFISISTFSQVGIGTTVPNASAKLDITATNKGVLIPRVSLNDVTDIVTPINTPAEGLLVYNTNVSVTGGSGVGFYFFNGTSWKKITSTDDTSSISLKDIGVISAFAGATYPNDMFLPISGGTFNDIDYPEFATFIINLDANIVTDNGNGTFTLANWNNNGVFLRSIGGNAGILGVMQNDATALPNSSFMVNPPIINTTTTGDHRHNIITRQDDWNVSGGPPSGGPSYGRDNGVLRVNNQTDSTGSHNHIVNIPPFSLNNGGDIETRPINRSITWVIKVKPSASSVSNLTINNITDIGTDDQNLTYNSATGLLSIEGGNNVTIPTGDITNVIAGDGLIGGGTSGDTTLNVVAINGLTDTANNIKLGGVLTKDTTITQGSRQLNFNLNGTGDFNIKDGVTYRFQVLNNGDLNVDSNTLYVDSSVNRVGIGVTNPTHKLHVIGDVKISSLSGTNNRLLQTDATGVLNDVTDGLAGQQLTTDGAGNYSWQTPIGDITSVTAGNGLIGGGTAGNTTVNVVAVNGLTSNANDVRWGGTLIQDTTITYGAYDTRFNLNGVGDFIIQDNGVGQFEINDTGRATFGDDTYWRDINTTGTTLASLVDDGNDGRFRINENGITSVDLDANTQFIFNEQGLDRNFRIESDSKTRMFFLDAGLNRVSIGTGVSAGTFNVLGNSYFSDDITLRDGAVNSGDTLVRMYDSSDDGVIDIFENNAYNHRIHGNGTTVFNEQGLALDFRIESDARPNMFIVDGNDNLVRIGTNSAGGTPESGSTRTVAGAVTTVNYVADFQIAGNNKNTTIGIGSVEFLHDAGNLYVMLHGHLLPFDDAVRTLGTSNWRWSALWATDGTINTSDLKQKKNIKPLSYGLEDIMKIETITFNWKNMANKDKKIGFSAQNLLKVLPEVVKTEELVTIDEETGKQELRPVENLGVYYSDIIPVTVKAIQELNTKIENLEVENKNLKVQLLKINELESKLNKLINKKP